MNLLQKIGLAYLYSVPPATAVIGFGIGHAEVPLYTTIWALNFCLMSIAIWQLKTTRSIGIDPGWTSAALLLIVPWMLFPLFAGMGPPPLRLAEWLTTATEQQVRYTVLIAGGIIAFMAFALLRVKLQKQGETIFSTLGLTAIGIAMPLFILNMIFWGYYLTDAFKIFVTLPQGKRPDWYPPVKTLFYLISVIEVVLIYFATGLFGIALRKVQALSYWACCVYIVVALLGMILVALPTSSPEPFSTLGYLAAIPAIPFVMPYLIGIRLLLLDRKVNTAQ
ncbi:hypothetical protein [Mucilaginibacter myungsuensis]|uniref:Uncharacterized protein n=1 Tax=Mucilaginibacter myungsuensis TaxID=649104 RepID=A0A929PWP4_9SPHI|nr:hypothetical protein [Mucilaginibacter myungsuensis]MBE9663048.1 hypothetical protein [Mucilaginibacter myungsuensis]MDN3598682.1 hypothetical protein [Mucilaginibacter myungsuensis]